MRRVNAQRLMLEYDDERSGSFEPLRGVPDDKTVVLGLVTTKSPRAETTPELTGRIAEAAPTLSPRAARHQSAMRVRHVHRRQSSDHRGAERKATGCRRNGARGLGLNRASPNPFALSLSPPFWCPLSVILVPPSREPHAPGDRTIRGYPCPPSVILVLDTGTHAPGDRTAGYTHAPSSVILVPRHGNPRPRRPSQLSPLRYR